MLRFCEEFLLEKLVIFFVAFEIMHENSGDVSILVSAYSSINSRSLVY